MNSRKMQATRVAYIILACPRRARAVGISGSQVTTHGHATDLSGQSVQCNAVLDRVDLEAFRIGKK